MIVAPRIIVNMSASTPTELGRKPNLRANETADHRDERLARERQHDRERRANETPEQREERLTKRREQDRERRAKARAEETPQQTEERLARKRSAEQRQQHRRRREAQAANVSTLSLQREERLTKRCWSRTESAELKLQHKAFRHMNDLLAGHETYTDAYFLSSWKQQTFLLHWKKTSFVYQQLQASQDNDHEVSQMTN